MIQVTSFPQPFKVRPEAPETTKPQHRASPGDHGFEGLRHPAGPFFYRDQDDVGHGKYIYIYIPNYSIFISSNFDLSFADPNFVHFRFTLSTIKKCLVPVLVDN